MLLSIALDSLFVLVHGWVDVHLVGKRDARGRVAWLVLR